MMVFAKITNGTQAQIKVKGDISKIFSFIENYKGDDLGNDLILAAFIELRINKRANGKNDFDTILESIRDYFLQSSDTIEKLCNANQS